MSDVDRRLDGLAVLAARVDGGVTTSLVATARACVAHVAELVVRR